MGYFIGVDTGGTFTDTVVIDDAGEVTIGKRSSTPPGFVEGVHSSLSDAASVLGLDREALLAETDLFLHGTTIVVNAIVEGTGARIGLITTAGFGDTIFIARSMSLWAGLSPERARRRADIERPAPIIPVSRQLVGEVTERVDLSGTVIVGLDEASVRAAIAALVDAGAEALAVCLLWSFKNPAHERRVAEIAAEMAPGLAVTLSSELAPKKGEYERMATTGFNSAMGKVASEYLGRVTTELAGGGLRGGLYIMQGNGGVLPVAEAEQRPVSLVGSGPAGGVLGAKLIAEAMGLSNVICTDVGGTSFDVGLIVDGEPLLTPKAVVNRHTLYLPLVDVVSIGAGGGSLARARTSGDTVRLTVGPESAGGRPGPVCYGLGGTQPTVTDADLVLGMLDPEFFLGGKMKLDVAGAREAIRTQVAVPLGMSVEEAAMGIVEIADHHMADLMRQVTVERGFDPRDFTAFLYGGGGPLHGTSYAAKLGLKSLVVPGGALASVLSAYGIASSDVHYTLERSERIVAPHDSSLVTGVLDELEAEAHRRLEGAGITPGRRSLHRSVEMAYGMQTHQIAVPIGPGPITAGVLGELVERFEVSYERLYGKGSAFREAGVEMVNFRLQAYGRFDQRPGTRAGAERRGAVAEPVGTRSVFWPETREATETAIYRGSDLTAAMTLEGPAVVELPTTTVAVRPGQRLTVDHYENYLINES